MSLHLSFCVRQVRMRCVLLLAAGILLGIVMTGISARAAPALMPVPASMSLPNGPVSLPGGIQIVWDTPPTYLLRQARSRFAVRFAQLAGPVGQGTPYILHIHQEADPAFLTVRQKEGYALTTAESGAHLEAEGPAGVLHGLATLLQLIERTPQGAQIERVHIDDVPRFPWRGVVLDVSRHFMSIAALERQLDAMELVKLNVLHWHLSDATGFRVESRLFPRLQTVAAHGQYYTQTQIHEIVAYAAERGIRIVPEFDVPGHALALVQAYPEFGAQTLPAGGVQKGNPNNVALDPTKPEVLNFVQALYAEMGNLFPDRYFHAGGDEVVASEWIQNPRILAYMQAHGFRDASAMQAAFTAQIQKVLANQGKIMMGWDEVTEAPVTKSVVVESWRGSKWTGTATKAGHPVVVSAGYYLDLLNPARDHYAVDPFDVQADGLSKADFTAIHRAVTLFYQPFLKDPNAPSLSEQQKSLVLGGETALWTEMVDETMLDARLWPRAAAIAERFWSPARVRDVDDMERRLPLVEAELETTGLRSAQNKQAMAEALASGHGGSVTVLTQATVPVRNYALNHMATTLGDALLRAPVAIAVPDAFPAIRFNAMALQYAQGEKGLASALRAQLQIWADNGPSFAQIAAGNALLESAVPASDNLAKLSRDGLRALDGTGNAAWRMDTDQLIAEQETYFRNSSNHLFSLHLPQPPGGLLIAILPGIKVLVDGHL